MKRILSIVCIIAMIFSLCNIAAFAEEADVIVITSGADFNNLVKTANYGKTFRIEGTETLADGSTGIILLDKQNSLSLFYGKIEGVDGKNNIQISKPLISSVGQADTGDVVIDNIVLKGSNADGTGAVSYADNAGALINSAASNYDYTVTITNVTNYLDVSSTKAKMPAGGIIGYVRYRKVTIKNCINKGKITSNTDASTDAVAGGIVGRFYGDAKESAVIENCFNYGAVTSSGCAAGIIGKGKAPAGSIEYCANFGEIKSSAATTSGGHGAAGISFHYPTTRYCFNAGNVESASMAGGIWGTGLAKTELSDCFNLGEISGGNSSCHPAGIVGSYGSTEAIVTNCYNLGKITGTNPIQIVDSKSGTTDEKSINNYYVSDTDLSQSVGTPITLEALATSLPAGFSSDVWTYTEDESYNYSLPQLKGNEFTNNINDAWGNIEIEKPVDPEPEEPEGPDYEINSAEEFNSTVFNDSSVIWTIKGTDDLGEGRYGIDLTKAGIDYISKTDFAGTIKGIEGANYIKVDKALFDSFKSYSTAKVENIILIGDITAANTYNGVLVNSTQQSGGTYEIRNVVNEANLTATAGTAGGIAGYSLRSAITFENCANYGKIISQASYAAGIIPQIGKIKLTAKSCKNYGEIEGKSYSAGIIAFGATAGTVYNIEKCANYGNVTSGTNNGANGIAGTMKEGYIKECFNAGEVVSAKRAASGIASVSAAEGSSVEISDCYNAGIVRSDEHHNELRPSGIASVTSAGATIIISNCYNVGELYAKSAATGANVPGYPIVDGAKAIVTNCYYINTDVATGRTSGGTYKLRHRFARVTNSSEPLPEGFNRENTPWVYLDKTQDNIYPYPQLKENQFKTTSKAYEVLAPQFNIEEVSAIEPFCGKNAEGLLIYYPGLTGGFAVTGAKFTYANATKEELKYGIILSKTVSGEELTIENCDIDAESKKSVSSDNQCSYGILFWGAEEGETYFIRPYVIFDDDIHYGETSAFSINSEA